jgi:hypothetical protein
MSNDLANLEALINIGANLGEIAGLAGGIPVLLWSWMPRAGGIRGVSLKLAGLSLLTVVLGLATPGIVNLAVPINAVLGLVVSWALCLGTLGLVIYILMTPSRIAKRIGHPQERAIRILNCCAFVPWIHGLCFLIAMIMVSFTRKSERKMFAPQALGCGLAHGDDAG